MEIVKAYFELDFDTRQKVFEHFRARLSAAATAPPLEEEAPPLELKSPAEMTDAEIDQLAEQMRQEMHREKEAVAGLSASPGFGTSSSRPPIGGSGGGVSGNATG